MERTVSLERGADCFGLVFCGVSFDGLFFGGRRLGFPDRYEETVKMQRFIDFADFVWWLSHHFSW